MSETLDMLLARLKDPYGHKGLKPHRQWSSVWTQWTAERRDAYLEQVAQTGIFSFDQVIDILQGLPPRPHGWDHAESYLDENSAAVERFRFDVEMRVIPPSLSDRELRAWCRARGIEVPDLIRPAGADENDAGGEESAMGAPGRQQYAAWITLPAQQEPAPTGTLAALQVAASDTFYVRTA